MRDHGRGRRSQTRTDRNYDIGRDYLAQKQKRGGDRKSDGIKSKKLALDRTAEKLAKKHDCSHQHVKTCAKLAEHIDRVCRPGGGLEWLRDRALISTGR